ncbi:ATP-binding protein [Bremerella sp. T1]|uniref:sensor histidine kinase n=1 Tax=Bremerella sp. TYQ1 TaxID=3119568 RepID=UPI001CCC4553|nr:sensor histidine kinase [Bremerella volcania]UBM38442.1 ATP-binding protein [Bremerella volcania]
MSEQSTNSTATFRFATDILQRLGEELNPSPDQGLLELVKNSFDANASECVVELIDTDTPGGTVRIRDDGDGMARDDIVDGWLVLGKSSKNTRRLTRLKRIPAGNKGLGRLAALRMGKTARLLTRPRSDRSREHLLEIDWNSFQNADLIENVPLSVRSQNREASVPHGTEIEIGQLKQRIGRWDVKRLARAMILLADPFLDDPTAFKPRLIATAYSDLEKLVRQRYFSEADYHLVAKVRNGKATASVLDSKGEPLFEAEHEDIIEDAEKPNYACPDARFEFWVFLLSHTSFQTRPVSLAQVKEWLGAFGGVHLYSNGLRVSPYGNPGHDWLDINLLRNRNPEERPGTHTSIGKVEVIDRNAVLVQKTDRSGFIETEAFTDLRRFAMDALEWMARRRMEVAEKRRASERTQAQRKTRRSKKKLDEVIQTTPEPVREELTEAAKAYDRSREKEVDRLKKEIQLYRTLATAGIMAATFAHESSASPIKVIRGSIRAIRRRGMRLFRDVFDEKFEEPVSNVENATESLGVLGAATLELLDHEKRRLGRVNPHTLIQKILNTFQPFLNGRGVEVQLILCSGEPYFRGSDAAFESIITNLINNSLAFFEKAGTQNRRIAINTQVVKDVLVLSVSDNGPGLVDIRPRDIWLPGQSTRDGGTGLGLTIVRDTVVDVGGKVNASESSELGGVEIIIEIPIIGR